ncbi:MAG: metallophosphoesterase family protein [Rhodothermales bacterium]
MAIGDIHGCIDTLNALLDRLALTEEDHLVFVGDYIDRGPDSKGVIDRLMALRRSQRCTFLRGNHESFMLDYLDGGDFHLWSMNGGVSTLRSYTDADQQVRIPDDHIAFVRETELYYDAPDFFFVHAGLRPGLTIADNLEYCGEEVFLWERGHLKARDLAWEKPVICGHTPRPEPINMEKLIDIDTGCVYHMYPQMGHLTAVRLPEREFVMVDYIG